MTAGLAGGSDVVPGVVGGKLVESGRSFTFVKYSITPGVTLSGTLQLAEGRPAAALPGQRHGRRQVRRDRAARRLRRNVRGTLGGHLVGH